MLDIFWCATEFQWLVYVCRERKKVENSSCRSSGACISPLGIFRCHVSTWHLFQRKNCSIPALPLSWPFRKKGKGKGKREVSPALLLAGRSAGCFREYRGGQSVSSSSVGSLVAPLGIRDSQMKGYPETLAVRTWVFGAISPCQHVFLDVTKFGSGFFFCPHSRLSQSPEVLDLATKSFQKDVSLGGCSLNKPPFLMLLQGSTRFNRAKIFNINQVSAMGFASHHLMGELEGGAGGVWMTWPQGAQRFQEVGSMGYPESDYAKRSRQFSF